MQPSRPGYQAQVPEMRARNGTKQVSFLRGLSATVTVAEQSRTVRADKPNSHRNARTFRLAVVAGIDTIGRRLLNYPFSRFRLPRAAPKSCRRRPSALRRRVASEYIMSASRPGTVCIYATGAAVISARQLHCCSDIDAPLVSSNSSLVSLKTATA